MVNASSRRCTSKDSSLIFQAVAEKKTIWSRLAGTFPTVHGFQPG
jgi:hypothetical protein